MVWYYLLKHVLVSTTHPLVERYEKVTVWHLNTYKPLLCLGLCKVNNTAGNNDISITGKKNRLDKTAVGCEENLGLTSLITILFTSKTSYMYTLIFVTRHSWAVMVRWLENIIKT